MFSAFFLNMHMFYASLFFLSLIILCKGGCPTAPLFAFIQNSTVLATMSPVGQYNLSYTESYNKTASNGSVVPMKCNSGYTLASGQLNITCTGDKWTTFPICKVSTKIRASDNLPCAVDVSSTFNITNGYLASSTLSFLSNTAATGSLNFACNTGYALDPSIGATYTCNNGVWSTKPTCLKTGRCSFTALQTFTSTAVGIYTTGQSSLMQVPTETGLVINGSYIVFACLSGYTNTGGSLNVTCGSNNAWSQFPNCVSNSGAACALDMSSTFNITNGYLTSSGLTFVSNTTATGSLNFACNAGYALDPNVGSTYTCNNGVWSTKPRCLITGRCSYSLLQTFTSTATGIYTVGQSNLMQVSGETGLVLNGSYIVFACLSGYVNTGGSLNVTCGSNNAWSQFPNCVSSSGSGSVTTITVANSGGSPCAVDMSSTFNITNGYLSSSGLTFVSGTTATGSLYFACSTGYALDPSVGSAYTCNNGVWSTKPRCLITGRCSFATLQSFTSTATGIFTTGQSSLMQVPGETGLILNGSYIVFACLSGYTNTGGSLNVTCASNNTWSQFPNCVSGSGGLVTTTTVASSGGSACAVDVSSTFNITNGYLTSSGLTFTSTTTVTGSLYFACITGYALDSSVGSAYTCNNGVWSTKPRCLITGRCSLTTLQSFTSTATGIFTTGQSSLMQASGETGLVLNGSYIVFACLSGYTNTGGSLNVTCASNNAWSQFPNCVSSTGGGPVTTTTVANNGGLVTTTTVASSGGSACAVDMSSTFNITNGYLTSSGLTFTSTTTVTGSLYFACSTGYALDPSVGSAYTCNNGVWSTKPRCLITGRCSFATLQSFTSTATGIFTTGQSSLMQVPGETGLVLNGSYIVFACLSGYTNTGGSLNVTCASNNTWSQFPNCVSSSGGGSVTTTTVANNGGLVTTTTVASSGGSACAVDMSSTFNITNGYLTSSGLTFVSTTTVTGSLYFACNIGYTLDPSVGGTYTCTNGVWSTKPRCLITGRCSYATLQSFTSTATGIYTTGQSSLMQASGETGSVLNGSYIVFACTTGYTNTGGSLNVTCGSNNSWSQFPSCVASGQVTTSSSNSGNGQGAVTTVAYTSTCATVPSVANAYIAKATSISYSNGVFVRNVVFACNAGYTYVATSGPLSVSCSNGVWGTLPVCTASATCSKNDLQNLFTAGMSIESNSLNVANANSVGILSGSWIKLACTGNYKWNPSSGALNVTCLTTGKWSTAPTCY